MNKRKATKGLNTDQVKELNAAWHHAARLGLPLNLLVTFRPLYINDMPENDRCKHFAALRNKLGVYARHHEFPATFAWSREINPNGTGEHMHVLIHVPTRRRLHFEDTITGWLPESGAIDVSTAHYQTRFSASGKRLNAISYIEADDAAGLVQSRPDPEGGRICSRQTGRRLCQPHLESHRGMETRPSQDANGDNSFDAARQRSTRERNSREGSMNTAPDALMCLELERLSAGVLRMSVSQLITGKSDGRAG